MSNAIEVRFVVGGVQEIDRAFRSVADAAARLERTTARAYDNDARAAARAAREKQRDNERAERDSARLRETGYRDNARFAADEVKATEKAEREKAKLTERWAKESLKFSHQASLEKQRILERELETEKRLRERHARAIGSMMHSSMGSALSRSTSTLAHGATGLAGVALGLGGGISLSGMMDERKALERASAYLSNQSSVTGSDHVTSRVSTQAIMGQARAIGLARNISPTDVVEGMNAYFAKTGDMSGTMKNAQLFADLHAATNVDMGQIASVAGALKIQNPSLDDKSLRSLMLNTVGQTRTGAVDIADLAKYVPAITSGSALYGGDQAENQRKLIGLSQVAIRTAGTNANAARSVRGLGVDFSSHADKIQAQLGVNVKDSNGMLRGPAELISQMMLASGGDIGRLKKAGIGAPAMNLFTSERGVFNDAGGGKAGAAAVLGDLKKFEHGAYTEDTLKSDIDNVTNTTGAKFEMAVARVKDVVEQKLAPYLERFADKFPEYEPKIEKFVDGIANAVDWLTNHPWAGVFALISANITAEMTKAAIGKITAAAIEKMLTASSAKGVSITGVAGAVTIAAAAVAITQMGKEQIDASLKNGADRRQAGINTELEATNLIARIKSGKGSPEDLAKGKALLTTMKGQRSAAMNASTGESDDLTMKLLGGLMTVTGNKEGVQQMHHADAQRFQSLTDTMAKLTTAIEKNGGGGSAAPAANRTTSISSRPTGVH